MKIPAAFFVLLLVGSFVGVEAQRNSTTTTTRAQATSSVSVSGSSSADLDAQLQQAADAAFQALEENPDDLNNVLQQLANVLLTEIGSVIVSVFEGGEIDAAQLSADISDSVGRAITLAASEGSMFESLDIDSITAEIRTNVEDALVDVDSDADISVVTTNLANVVLNAIGNALAEVTGSSFSFELSVEASSTTSGATTTGTVSTGGVSLEAFEASFVSSAEEALATLESNPDDLNVVMEQVATILLNSISRLLVNATTNGEIEAESLSLLISNAVESVLTTTASSGSTFSDLDVNAITSNVQRELERVLTEASNNKDINLQTLTSQVVSVVIEQVGTALADASGATFSFTIRVGGASGSTSASASQTSSTTTTTSTTTIEGTSLLESELQSSLEQALTNLESNPDDINVVFSTVANVFLSSLTPVITTILNGVEIDAEATSATITSSIESALSAAAASSSQFEDLDDARITSEIQASLNTIFGEVDSDTDVSQLTVDVVNAVLTPIGDTLSDITGGTFTFSVSLETASGATSTTSSSQSRETQLQVSINILSQLSDTDASFQLIQDAASEGQNIAISAAFLQAIEEGQTEDLNNILVRFFTDDSISAETVSFVLTLTITQGGSQAAQALIDTIQSTEDKDQLIATFQYAFTSPNSNVTEAFTSLITDSVSGSTCGLGDVVSTALEGLSPEEAQSVIASLEAAGAQTCVSDSAPTTPTTSTPTTPTPTSTPTIPTPASTTTSTSTATFQTASSQTTSTTEEAEEPSAEVQGEVEASPTSPAASTPTEVTTSSTSAEVTTSQQGTTTLAPPTEDTVSSSSASAQVSVSSSGTSTPTSGTPTPSAQAQAALDSGECIDVAPPGGYSCEEQEKFGKCERAWMKESNFCAKTCEFCPTEGEVKGDLEVVATEGCTDIAPDDRHTCAEQKEFGKCESSWLVEGGYCKATCGNCDESTPPPARSTLTPEATPTPSLAPILSTASTKANSECECTSCCGCALDEEMMAKMVKDVVTQVLAEINV